MPINVHILSLFPDMFVGPFGQSIVKRAMQERLVDIKLHDVRDKTYDRHSTADDYQYGGGSGMVMKPEPLFESVEAIQQGYPRATFEKMPVVVLSPQGRLFSQNIAEGLSNKPGFLLICGHYQGIDHRVFEHLVSDEISIGDYVLSGGEIAAMVIVDAVVRLIPGAVGSQESVATDSITSGLLQHPVYTRPADYRNWKVPSVLLSGDHRKIEVWRRQQSLLRTLKRRPDLVRKVNLTSEDRSFLSSRGFIDL